MQETSPEQLQWESKELWTQERMVPPDCKAAGREMEGCFSQGDGRMLLAGRGKDAAGREMEGWCWQGDGRVHKNLRILAWRKG